MRSTGKQPLKPIETSITGPAIMLVESDPQGDQERDEEDISDTRNYQAGTKAFREVASEESEALDAVPNEAGEVSETSEAHEAEKADVEKTRKAVNSISKSRAKTRRSSKEK